MPERVVVDFFVLFMVFRCWVYYICFSLFFSCCFWGRLLFVCFSFIISARMPPLGISGVGNNISEAAGILPRKGAEVKAACSLSMCFSCVTGIQQQM